MIKRTRQDWTPGQIVKVGFLSLRVLSARAERDYLPDIYTLISLDGQKYYEFIPHNGLSRTDRIGHPCLACGSDSKLNGNGICSNCSLYHANWATEYYAGA